jgi:hypothetical protein
MLAALALAGAAVTASPARAEYCTSEFNLATLAYRGELPGIDSYLGFCSDLWRMGERDFAEHIVEVAVLEDRLAESCVEQISVWAVQSHIRSLCTH